MQRQWTLPLWNIILAVIEFAEKNDLSLESQELHIRRLKKPLSFSYSALFELVGVHGASSWLGASRVLLQTLYIYWIVFGGRRGRWVVPRRGEVEHYLGAEPVCGGIVKDEPYKRQRL